MNDFQKTICVDEVLADHREYSHCALYNDSGKHLGDFASAEEAEWSLCPSLDDLEVDAELKRDRQFGERWSDPDQEPEPISVGQYDPPNCVSYKVDDPQYMEITEKMEALNEGEKDGYWVEDIIRWPTYYVGVIRLPIAEEPVPMGMEHLDYWTEYQSRVDEEWWPPCESSEPLSDPDQEPEPFGVEATDPPDCFHVFGSDTRRERQALADAGLIDPPLPDDAFETYGDYEDLYLRFAYFPQDFIDELSEEDGVDYGNHVEYLRGEEAQVHDMDLADAHRQLQSMQRAEALTRQAGLGGSIEVIHLNREVSDNPDDWCCVPLEWFVEFLHLEEGESCEKRGLRWYGRYQSDWDECLYRAYMQDGILHVEIDEQNDDVTRRASFPIRDAGGVKLICLTPDADYLRCYVPVEWLSDFLHLEEDEHCRREGMAWWYEPPRDQMACSYGAVREGKFLRIEVASDPQPPRRATFTVVTVTV
jgi:hypothetical protein